VKRWEYEATRVSWKVVLSGRIGMESAALVGAGTPKQPVIHTRRLPDEQNLPCPLHHSRPTKTRLKNGAVLRGDEGSPQQWAEVR
jgi:hypothetical protein